MSRKIYLLSPLGYKDTLSLPMIEFSLTVSSLDLSTYDLLMFTSKQAVLSTEVLNPQWKEIPCLAIGKATSRQIEALGGTVFYQSESFYAKVLAQDIVNKFQDKRIVYLRPKVVSFDLESFLASRGIKLSQKVIYETQCKVHPADKKPSKDAIIVFTSPSTIECFFKNFTWDSSYAAVVIGESTKAHLPSDISIYVADEPCIRACVDKAKQILLSSNSK